MCSRPASPNCPGSLFTFIHHYPPVIVANAHCTRHMLPEHTREKKPFYDSDIFPSSSVHIASSFHFPEVTEVLHCWLMMIDSWVPHAPSKVVSVQWILDTSWQNLVFSKFIKAKNLILSTGLLDTGKLCEAREKMNIWVAWLAWWPKFATAPTHTHT